jgi:hypothetical protein
MALSLTTLATRWGKEIGGLNEAATYGGTTVGARADSVLALFGSLSAQADVIDDLYENAVAVRAAVQKWQTDLADLVRATLSAMCRDDSARPKSDAVADLFDKLNRDMIAQAETFARPTVTGTVAAASLSAGSNFGDGYLVGSVVEPADGITCYFAYAEVVRLLCVADSYSGDTSEGAEVFTANGETKVDALDYRWPKGSGAGATLTAVTPDSAGVLVDPGLEEWGGSGNNTPSEWGLTTGTVAGTHVFRGSSSPYAGTYYAQFTGDGAAAVGVYQELDQTKVASNTNYAVQLWVKVPAATLATANLRIALTDGNAAVITDNAGTSQSNTTNAAGLNAATAWTRVTCVLRTPRSLPDQLRLDIRFPSGAVLDNAKSVYVDAVTLTPMGRLYPGGPYLAVCAGATGFADADGFTYTVANNKTGTNFVRALDRVFGLAALGLRLQTTTGTATQLDSLIS